jgi:hypothetical protein
MLLKRQKEVVRDLQRRRGVSADLRTYATHALTYAGTCYWRTLNSLTGLCCQTSAYVSMLLNMQALSYWLTGLLATSVCGLKLLVATGLLAYWLTLRAALLTGRAG